MRKLFRTPARVLVALALLCGVLGGTAHADQPVWAKYLKLSSSSASNPCLSIDPCIWRKTDGHIYFSLSNVDWRLDGGFPQVITATFTAVDNVALSWSNLGGTQAIFVGVPIVTDGGGGVVFHLTSKTSTGATLNASAPWTGTVAITVVSQ